MLGEVCLNDTLGWSLDTIHHFTCSVLLQAEMLCLIFEFLREDTEYGWVYVRTCHVSEEESLNLLESYCLLQ